MSFRINGRYKLFLAIASTVLITCCTDNNPSGTITENGGGTQTGNPQISGIVSDSAGIPVAGARVTLRPVDYLASIPSPLMKMSYQHSDTVTDSLGRYAINDIDSGSYLIEMNKELEWGALLKLDLMDDSSSTGEDTLILKKTVSITGSIPNYRASDESFFVQMYGLERIAPVDGITGTFVLSGIPQGEFDIRLISTDPNREPVEVENVSAYSDLTLSVPVDLDWEIGIQVLLNTTASGADIQTSLYNFPVMVKLDENNFDFSRAEPNGEDIRFLKPDSTPLFHEIEQWDVAASSAVFWVKVDTIHGNDTTFLALQWGAPEAGIQSNPGAVFDTAQGYQAVWHMGQNGDSVIKDVTYNQFHGTPIGMDSSSDVAGIIGGATMFGRGATVTAPGSNESILHFPVDASFTISAWLYTDTLINDYQMAVSKGNEKYSLHINTENQWEFFMWHGDSTGDTTKVPAEARVWTHISVTREGGVQSLYINGTLMDQTAGSISAEPLNDPYPLMFGNQSDGDSRWFDGMLDEIRMLNRANSEDWVKLNYENQKPQQTFVQVREVPKL